MRVLKFIVNGQTIEKDPSCDFSGLIPGTSRYLKAEFSFSPEWKPYTKVAAFYSMLGEEYPPQILANGTTCMIPAEACARRVFKIKVLGGLGDFKIATDKVEVIQNGGKT